MGAVLLDKVRPFPEPCVVLGVMPAGLCHIIVQVEEHLVSYYLLVVYFRILRDRLPDQRICILSVPLEFKIERLVVDAGAKVRDLVHRGADPPGQHGRCPLDAVAQARHLYAALALHRPAQHCHRVRIIEEYGIRAITLYVFADVQHDRYRPQCPENPGRSPGIAYIYVHAVLFRDLDIMAPYIHPAGKYGADHAVCALQRFCPVRGGSHLCRVIACCNYLVHGSFYVCKPLGVNVHQCYLRIRQCRE